MVAKDVFTDFKNLLIMTTIAEIDSQIKEDYNRFWHSQYDGALPSGIIFIFKQALMSQSCMSLQGAPEVLREIISKTEDSLKIFEVGMVLNTVLNTPFDRMYESIEQALDAATEIKQIEIGYNKMVEEVGKKLERKRMKKMEICGHTKAVPFNQ